MSRKLIVLIIGIILVCGYFLYLTFPLYIIGPPSSVYDIKNFDDEVHFINVVVFDENRNPIYQDMDNLEPNENLELEREVNFIPPIPSNLFTWVDGPYTFYFTIDDSITENITIDPWPYETICVWLYFNEEPIDILISTV